MSLSREKYLGEGSYGRSNDRRYADRTVATFDRHVAAACDAIFKEAQNRKFAIADIVGNEDWVEEVICKYEDEQDLTIPREHLIITMIKKLTP